jgi:hypothetical protein
LGSDGDDDFYIKGGLWAFNIIEIRRSFFEGIYEGLRLGIVENIFKNLLREFSLLN